MATNDSKRYYWIKLKKDFFQQHQIRVLKALPNGRLYALIYLELLAESTSHNGELRYSQMLPYDITTLASVIDEDVDNLKGAIATLSQLELVEILEDKTIYLREIQTMIGSSTGQTIRKTQAKIKGGKNYQKITQDNRYKSIEYKSLDIRDKNMMIDRYKESGIDETLIKNALELLNGIEINETIFNKALEIIEDEKIINKKGYLYKTLGLNHE